MAGAVATDVHRALWSRHAGALPFTNVHIGCHSTVYARAFLLVCPSLFVGGDGDFAITNFIRKEGNSFTTGFYLLESQALRPNSGKNNFE